MLQVVCWQLVGVLVCICAILLVILPFTPLIIWAILMLDLRVVVVDIVLKPCQEIPLETCNIFSCNTFDLYLMPIHSIPVVSTESFYVGIAQTMSPSFDGLDFLSQTFQICGKSLMNMVHIFQFVDYDISIRLYLVIEVT